MGECSAQVEPEMDDDDEAAPSKAKANVWSSGSHAGVPTSESAASMEGGSGDGAVDKALPAGMGLNLRSPLGALIDAYANEPMAFTNFVNDFHGTLDYILTSPGLASVKRLPGVSKEELRPDGVQGGLPNDMYPSDHLSIAADLELIEQ